MTLTTHAHVFEDFRADLSHQRRRCNRAGDEADARTRTGDPFITSEVLYQLSYVGGAPPLGAPLV